jgi:hypothetical protein
MEETINTCTILVGNPERKRSLADVVGNVRIILKWIANKWGVRLWTGFI